MSKSSSSQRLNTVSPSSRTPRHRGAQTGSCGRAGLCGLRTPAGLCTNPPHWRLPRGPSSRRQNSTRSHQKSQILGQDHLPGLGQNQEKRNGSCPSHPSSWPAAHQPPLLRPQNTHQNATVPVLTLTQCRRTISQREQERGGTARQPS